MILVRIENEMERDEIKKENMRLQSSWRTEGLVARSLSLEKTRAITQELEVPSLYFLKPGLWILGCSFDSPRTKVDIIYNYTS